MKEGQVEITIWGRHSIAEALESSRARVVEIWIADHREAELEKIAAKVRQKQGKVQQISREALTKRINTDKHQNVAARVVLDTYSGVNEWLDHQASNATLILLVLDGIEDPQNFGAILRSAHFFGVNAVLFAKDRAASVTGSVAKASAGALFSIPLLRVTNISRELEVAAEVGFWRIGLDAEAETVLADVDTNVPKLLLAVGGEGEGLRRLTAKNCDQLVRLTRKAGRDSLNASVAAAVALYQSTRHL